EEIWKPKSSSKFYRKFISFLIQISQSSLIRQYSLLKNRTEFGQYCIFRGWLPCILNAADRGSLLYQPCCLAGIFSKYRSHLVGQSRVQYTRTVLRKRASVFA